MLNAMTQKNWLQRLSHLSPTPLKSWRGFQPFIKYSSLLSSRIGWTNTLYDDEVSIVFRILSDLKKQSSAEEIRLYQDECRKSFNMNKEFNCSSRELVLFSLVRVLKPQTVVETGCAWGNSASYLLSALDKNKTGRLISIDLPAANTIQQKWMGVEEKQIGSIIPTNLKDRWELIIGDARRHLGKILSEVNADIFIHDSLHTTTHQFFEYITARSLMREGTLIASDDIRWNNSFPTFLKLNHLKAYAPFGNKNFGITINAFDNYEKHYGLFHPPQA